MKVCTKCKIEKDLSEFIKDKTTKSGIGGKCKSCANEYVKKHYKANSQKQLKFRTEFLKAKEDGYHYVYLLPKENYVGCTKNVYVRMYGHRALKRDTSGYIILGRFNDRDEALRLETSYHNNGYTGKHAFNVYK